MSTHFLFQMKSPQFRFLCRWHFLNFWSFPFLSFGHFWRQLYLFWKVIFQMGSLPACSWAAWSLPYLTRKLLSAQLPTAQPSGTQICFWFSFPQLWGERKRFSLIQNQASVLCWLLLPSGTFKVLQELLRGKEGPGCYLLEKGNQDFSVYMRHIWPHFSLCFPSNMKIP